MTGFYRLMSVVGLLMIAMLYLWLGAIEKLMDWSATVGYITQKGLPWPSAAAAVAVAVELIAPLAMFKREWRVSALLALAMYTISVSLMFHDFWRSDDAAHAQLQNVLKNLAISGSLFFMAAQQKLATPVRTETNRVSIASVHPRTLRQ